MMSPNKRIQLDQNARYDLYTGVDRGWLIAFMESLYHPKELPTLTTFGQAWLGLAVSSAYTYFRIKPPTG